MLLWRGLKRPGRGRVQGLGGAPHWRGVCEGLQRRIVLLQAGWVEAPELLHPDLSLGTWLCLRMQHPAMCESTGSAPWAMRGG